MGEEGLLERVWGWAAGVKAREESILLRPVLVAAESLGYLERLAQPRTSLIQHSLWLR